MGSPTPFFATRLGEYIIDRELDALDNLRLKADELDAEARETLTYQDWLEQLAVLDDEKQGKILDALQRGDTFSRWVIEVATTTALDNAVKLKAKEILDARESGSCDTH